MTDTNDEDRDFVRALFGRAKDTEPERTPGADASTHEGHNPTGEDPDRAFIRNLFNRNR